MYLISIIKKKNTHTQAVFADSDPQHFGGTVSLGCLGLPWYWPYELVEVSREKSGHPALDMHKKRFGCSSNFSFAIYCVVRKLCLFFVIWFWSPISLSMSCWSEWEGFWERARQRWRQRNWCVMMIWNYVRTVLPKSGVSLQQREARAPGEWGGLGLHSITLSTISISQRLPDLH